MVKRIFRVFENRALRIIVGPRREAEEDCIMRSVVTYILHRILFG
jgi:hypothetical protein